ncbi:MAG TPA: glutathione S-transferase N-terminal domain-containing protein [Devosiaceae bacterium]|jgi:GST-like protein|nr:glutathione S-transferase N-terminal domain-containing protein [Devosiaceae bacterium]
MTTQQQAIELYYDSTPNGRKITIMLEELGLPYSLNWVRIGRGDQFKPEFLAISPNNKIPAIVDPEGPGGDPISIFESGAILKYLAEKFDRLYPADRRSRVMVDEWLFWQVGGFGPMLGQAHHFLRDAPERMAYASERYQKEAQRLYRVLDTRLGGREFVAGDYSIADIAIFAWAHRHPRHRIDLADYPEVERWYRTLEARPAVATALAIRDPEAG